MIKYTPEKEIPYGYCQCGCGQKTEIAKRTNSAKNHVKGKPLKFVKFHWFNSTVEELYTKFWINVNITANDDLCWEWTAGQDGRGYGAMKFDKVRKAPQIAWMYPNYVIPDGMEICHSCDNPLCCNPKHLFLGTHQENMADKIRKGRGNYPKGDTHHLAILSIEQRHEIRTKHSNGTKQNKLAAEYGVSNAYIHSIVHKYARFEDD